VRSETTTSIPAARQARISSLSQSSPRGRGETLSRPGHSPGIGNNSVGINVSFDHDLTLKKVHIDSARTKNMQAMMAIENGSIWPGLQATCRAGHQRPQNLIGSKLL
jgi:hypothetical protein